MARGDHHRRRAFRLTPASRPTRHALARYAALCQEGGIVPIVEPEVLLDGNHSIERCQDVTEETLRITFAQLADSAFISKA